MKSHNRQQGITIFFAILIIGLMLGVGLSVTLLAQKQLSLSSFSSQSELAFYAADSSTECAEYWDKNSGASNPFSPTSTVTQVIQCDNERPSIDPGLIHNFQIDFGTACASTTISKVQQNGVWITEIESHGYNTCNVNAPERLERAIYVSY